MNSNELCALDEALDYLNGTYLIESTINSIPSEVSSFINSLNTKIKKVDNKDFRNIKFKASIDQKDRDNASISNNRKLSEEGTIIVISLPFNGAIYRKGNPFKFAFDFIEREFNESGLVDKYNLFTLRIINPELYATINPKTDSKDIFNMRNIIKNSKELDIDYYDASYMDEDELKKAFNVKTFLDSFKKKYNENVSYSFDPYRFEIYMNNEKYSNSFYKQYMKQYMEINDKADEEIEKYLKLGDENNKDYSKEIDDLEEKAYEDKRKLLNKYINQKIIPALNSAEKETGIKYIREDFNFNASYTIRSSNGKYKNRLSIFIRIES